MSDLPTEVWALICQYLDKPQLCGVRLVSPRASHEAARHLFQSISLNTEDTRIGSFIALVEQCGRHSRIREHIKKVNFDISLPPAMSLTAIFRCYHERSDESVRDSCTYNRLLCLTGRCRLNCDFLMKAFRKLPNLNAIAVSASRYKAFAQRRTLSSYVADILFLQICELARRSKVNFESLDVSTAVTGLICSTIFERPQSRQQTVTRQWPFCNQDDHSWSRLAVDVSQDLGFLVNLKHLQLDIDFCAFRAGSHALSGQSHTRSWLKDALCAMAPNLEILSLHFRFTDGSPLRSPHLCFSHRLLDSMSGQRAEYHWEVCMPDTRFFKLRTLRLKNVVLLTGVTLASFLERHQDTLESVRLEPWTCLPRLPCPLQLHHMTPQAAPELLRLVTFVSSGAEARLDYDPGKSLLVQCQRQFQSRSQFHFEFLIKEIFCEVNAARLYHMYRTGMSKEHAMLALM